MFAKKSFLLLILFSNNLFSQSRTSLECVEREFNVIVHIVTDSLRIPKINASQANVAIAAVNIAWKPICMKFNICEIRIDSNFNFMKWHIDTMEKEYLALNYRPRLINIIVVDSIKKPVNASGYASLGGISSRNRPYVIVTGSGGALWIHELGHYFGLDHTFEGTSENSPVLADNSNCSSNGDFICDSPPDPYEFTDGHYDKTDCIYLGSGKDANGKYYNPLIENYMSYYSGCKKSFTHMQYEKMILTYKIDPEAHF